MFVTKLRGKKPDPKNFTNIIAKEYYNSYLEKKNTKTVKRSKAIPQQLKAIEQPNIVDIKSVITDFSETL